MGGCHDQHDAKVDQPDPKVTTMVLHVDLGCCQCYKKVKKILCKFPQIRDQRFDEKQNTVTIRVVCCSPEKIRDKLCCKGGKSITSIQIVKPVQPSKPKPPPDRHPAPPSQPPCRKPPPETPPQPPCRKPPPATPPQPPCRKLPPAPPPQPRCQKPAKLQCVPECPPRPSCCGPCSDGIRGEPCYQGCRPGPPCQPIQGQPITACCGPCSQEIPGGPCYHQGYGPRSGPCPSYCCSYGYEPRYCRCEPRYCRCECYNDGNQVACFFM